MTKKRIITIIVCAFLAVVLCFAVFFISKMDDKPQEESPDNTLDIDHENERNVIYSCEVADIEYLQVINKYGDYKVRRDSDNNIYIEGREGAPLLPYSSVGLYESVKRITCDLSIENGTEHPEYYGLDNPGATVRVMLKNGTETVFYIGNEEPSGNGYYIRMDGSSDVYLVGSFYGERYLSDFLRYYDKQICEWFDITEFEYLSIKKSDGSELYIRTTNESESHVLSYINGYVMEKPFLFGADSAPLHDLVTLMCDLDADSVVCDYVDADSLTEYGFDNPTAVEIKLNLDTTAQMLENQDENPFYKKTEDGSPYPLVIKYALGKTVDNTVYVMVNDAPVIYAVKSSAFEYVDRPIYQYCQKFVGLEYLNNLTALDVSFDEKTYHFTIKDPDAGENMIVKENNITLDADNFRSFYSTIVSVTHNGIETDPQSEPVMSVVYYVNDGSRMTLEFLPCPDSARKMFIRVNGEGRFFCYVTKVDKVKSDLVKLLNGEEID